MPRKQHRIFWSTIARFVICLHFPEHNRRSGYTTYKPFFTPEGGIQIAATNDNQPYSHLENLWGETSKISLATHRLLKECDTTSCRTICSPPGGTHHYLITGPIALCNFACEEHATAIPGELLNHIVDPSAQELENSGLSPCDWRTASTKAHFLESGRPITIFYHPVNTEEDETLSEKTNYC
jgi:hypothetical protein